MPRSSRTGRAPMSRERVLAAAIELADAEGLDGLTMRRLAQGLGVEAMSLYHYFPSKEALIEAMIASVMGEIDLPSRREAWKPAIRRLAVSANRVLLRHPWAAGRMLSSGLTPERLSYMETVLRILREGGFDPYQAHLAYHAVESHIVGFALWVGGMALPDDEAELVDEVMGMVSADENPYFVEHLGEHVRPRRRGDVGSYEFGLDLMLDGLERMLAAM